MTKTRTQTKVGTQTAVGIGFAAIGFAAAFVFITNLPLLKFTDSANVRVVEYVQGTEDAIALEFFAQAGQQAITVEELTFDFFGDNDGDFTTVNDDVSGIDHVTFCELRRTDTGAVIAGPSYVDANNKLVFNDAWMLSSKQKLAISIDCDLVHTDTEGADPDLYAFKLNVTDVVATKTATGTAVTTQEIAPRLLNGTGAFAMRVLNEGSFATYLHASTPSGASVPGLQEVLRFNVVTGPETFGEIDDVLFSLLTTDNANSNWNMCGAGLSGSDFRFSRLEDDGSLTPIEISATLLEADGSTCNGSDVAYIWFRYMGTTIDAESLNTYVVTMDTTGASASQDDAVSLRIQTEAVLNALATPRDAFKWIDNAANVLNGDAVTNLPLTGGTIVF